MSAAQTKVAALAHYQAEAAKAGTGRHHHLSLSPAWDHHQAVDLHAWVPESARATPRDPNLHGRAALCFSSGGFDLHLRPMPPELRAMAAALWELADDLDRSALGSKVAS